MNTQEIRPEDWREFCEKFTEANRGSLLTIEMIGADGIQNDVARDVPLDTMTFDKTDACNDVISISFGKAGQKRLIHSVIEPIHLRVKQTKGSKLLEILAENGTTLLTFHSGRFPPMNNGEEKGFAIPS